MGLTKTDQFTERQNEVASLAKAIGHPARVAIIEHLLKENSCVCGSIVDALPLAQATVSQHLKELKTAGIIKGNIEGTSICYCINEVTWNKFKDILSALFEEYELSKNKCC